MCTIGAVYNKGLILFKNCDLKKNVKFFKPKVKKGKYTYLAFTRKGRPGLWAGVNERGLGIVAADAHTKKKYRAKPYMIHNIFRCYEKTIAEQGNVDDAERYLKNYYKKKVCVPDLIIIADRKNAKVIEFTPGKWVTESIKKGFILRSNHFIRVKGSVTRKKDLDSHLRYETGVKLLKKDSSLRGVMKLCKDHTNGPSINSICRHGKRGNLRTQASAVVCINEKIKAYYIINNFPCKTKFKTVSL